MIHMNGNERMKPHTMGSGNKRCLEGDSPLINCPFLTCHSDGEVSCGLFVPPEDTNINSRVLIRHICDFYDRTTDLNAGRGQNPESLLVPIEGHAGSGIDVTAQLENIPRLQQKMF